MSGLERFALVRNALSVESVSAYLPSGYRVLSHERDTCGRLLVTIGGRDAAGWTLDAYVIPRLASGLMWANEIDTYGNEDRSTPMAC